MGGDWLQRREREPGDDRDDDAPRVRVGGDVHLTLPLCDSFYTQSPPRARRSFSLARRLGPYDAAAIIVSNVIGGGILFSPPQVAANVPHPWLFLATWLARRRGAGVRRSDGVRRARHSATAIRRRVRLSRRGVRPSRRVPDRLDLARRRSRTSSSSRTTDRTGS